MGASSGEREGRRRAGSSAPSWPTSFCTMRSICGCAGTSRTYCSNAMPMMRSVTVVMKTKPQHCGLLLRRGFAECGLTLHPEKTKIVYCKDQSRRENHPTFKFDFLGYTFRPRMGSKRAGGMGVSFSPAASTKALTAIRGTIRSWSMHRRSDKGLDDLARMFNSHIRGWINYYGRFCPSALYPTLRLIDLTLARWASGKFKSLRGHKLRSRHWLARIARHQPRLFAHWSLLYGRGRTMGAG